MAANVWIVTGTSVSVYKSLNLDNELFGFVPVNYVKSSGKEMPVHSVCDWLIVTYITWLTDYIGASGLVSGNKCIIIIHGYIFIIIYLYSPDGIIVSLCILREVIMDLCYTMSGLLRSCSRIVMNK